MNKILLERMKYFRAKNAKNMYVKETNIYKHNSSYNKSGTQINHDQRVEPA